MKIEVGLWVKHAYVPELSYGEVASVYGTHITVRWDNYGCDGSDFVTMSHFADEVRVLAYQSVR